MAEKTELSKEKGMETEQLRVHLFNCDKTYKFGPIRTLLSDVEKESKWKFSVEEHYFPLPKMAETCDKIPKWEMDFAVFVVHANESRLSLNEEKAGIGYAKIYRTLLRTTNDRVLIVIGGDDNYKGEETSQVLSRWAKMKISSQFSIEYLDGRKSFVFSWEQKHRHIHKDALLHFLDKKGEVFVPKPRPVPTLPEKNMGEKVLAGELASQSKTKQSQATREQAPKIKELTPQTVKPTQIVAGTTLEKKHFDPLQRDLFATTGGEEKQSDPLQGRFSGTHYVSPQPHQYVPQPAKASPYGDKQSASTKDWEEKNFGKRSAVSEVHQKSKREEMKGNGEAPTTVNVAIIECEVSDQRSVGVAHSFIYEVAKQLKLNPNIESIKGGNPKYLLEKLLKYTENDSFSYVVLLVDKEVFRNISTDKKKLTSYSDLLVEIQYSAGTQAILIVCNDQDPIPHDQVHSNSVGNLLKRVKSSGIKIDENRLITLSWNEYEQNFSLEKHIQYLVKGEYEAGPRHKNTATTREEVYYAPDSSANHEGRPMDYNVDVPSNASQGRPSTVEDKGNIVWEGRLKSGEIITTYKRPGWEPPDLILRTIYRDKRHKSCTEFRVVQAEDGPGFNILYGPKSVCCIQ